jgi:hypothetical protein
MHHLAKAAGETDAGVVAASGRGVAGGGGPDEDAQGDHETGNHLLTFHRTFSCTGFGATSTGHYQRLSIGFDGSAVMFSTAQW